MKVITVLRKSFLFPFLELCRVFTRHCFRQDHTNPFFIVEFHFVSTIGTHSYSLKFICVHRQAQKESNPRLTLLESVASLVSHVPVRQVSAFRLVVPVSESREGRT